MMSLDAFIAKYQGKKGIGTNPSDMGECGGLYNKGTEEMFDLKYPIRGVQNMGDLLEGNNTQPDKVQIIYNKPDPNWISQRGDAVVFNPGPTGDPRGHVGWCIASDTSRVTIFDQSQGIACAIRSYNYTKVKGWIRFKGEDMADKITPEVSKVLQFALLGRNGLAGRDNALTQNTGTPWVGELLTNTKINDIFASPEAVQYRQDVKADDTIPGVNRRLATIVEYVEYVEPKKYMKKV